LSSTSRSFLSPIKASYGEWFVAPDNATLSEFDFVIQNTSPGTNATFVLATWSPISHVPVTPLFEQSSFVNNDGSFDVNVNTLPNIRLVAGQDYIAFLTVSSALPPVPEPSTWAMLLLGFAGLGFARYRQRHKFAGAASIWGPSHRTAWQFIQDLAGRLGKPLAVEATRPELDRP
jgi:PEP-CTERM motif